MPDEAVAGLSCRQGGPITSPMTSGCADWGCGVSHSNGKVTLMQNIHQSGSSTPKSKQMQVLLFSMVIGPKCEIAGVSRSHRADLQSLEVWPGVEA